MEKINGKYCPEMTLPTKNDIISIDDAKILVWEMTEKGDLLCQEFDDFELYRMDYELISSEKRKLEFLGSRLLLKILLGKEQKIMYDNNGKPYLSDNSYQISISHSKNWITVIIHPSKVVGIDIECPNSKIQKIYTRFLSETEQSQLSNGKNIEQLQLAWSAKEALYKIIGKEAIDFSNHMQILPFEVFSKGELKAMHLPTKKNYTLNYFQTEAYTLVYCIA